MMKGLFITGTDTGVGKTFIAEGIIRSLRKRGIDICPMKPVETGCGTKNGCLVPGDALRLIRASGTGEPVERINPFRFREPLAPYVAAGIEGKAVRRRTLVSSYHYLARRHDIVVVEGAGGIMVPITGTYLFCDFISDIGIPAVIVSRPGLGTINHTLLTIEAARKRDIPVAGVVINDASPAKKGIAVQTNPDMIRRFGKVPVLGVVPHARPGTGLDTLFGEITARLMGRLRTHKN